MPKSIHRNSALASLVLITGLFATSCVKSIDPKVLQLRNELTAKVEPKDSISLTDAKTVLAEEADVVLLGRVGSGDLDPFEKGKAMFVLSEAPEDHGDGKGHDASECPFCKRKADEAPLAQIEFKDPSGTPIAYGANELFGLRKGQIVVVQGRGRYEKDTDTLVIQGTGIFVRP